MWLSAASSVLALVAGVVVGAVQAVERAGKQPNIVVIMGDDIGWFNIGAYHQGIMAGRTPNRDELAAEGMRLTDYYAEASCASGRAAFVTGELTIGTGMTMVGQASSPIGIPAQVANGIIAGLDWFPTCVAAACDPNINDDLLKGKQLGDTTDKVHLDGYNQLELITGTGPSPTGVTRAGSAIGATNARGERKVRIEVVRDR